MVFPKLLRHCYLTFWNYEWEELKWGSIFGSRYYKQKVQSPEKYLPQGKITNPKGQLSWIIAQDLLQGWENDKGLFEK